ncbi:MAG: OsmC family protein [Candidatus Cloacimonetes bacterium]|nr:OsmC family protein [Candidatus Cloacimonadota bacterium]
MPQKNVAVKANLGKTYEVELLTRHFTLKIDQPKPSGNDSAPTPLEFLFFAIGACACTIGKILAEQRKIELKSMKVDVDGDIDTDYLLGKTNEGRAGFSNIRLNVEIDANLNKDEKEEFLKEVLRRCPVSDNVENSSNVLWKIKD